MYHETHEGQKILHTARQSPTKELNSGTRAYRISLLHRAQSQLKVAGSPRLLLDFLQPLRARRVALMQFATS